MSFTIIDDIPFTPDLDTLLDDLHIAPDSEDVASVRRMVDAAQAVACPKAACYVGAIEGRTENQVTIAGVTLTSRVLRVNLDAVNRAFVFVATAGEEIERWAAGVKGLLERFWADMIAEQALRAAIDGLWAFVAARYQPGDLSMMNPGSLDDWPMSEQRALFAILDGRTDEIGVQLADNLLMHPVKSVSGVLFAAAETFESCQLCPVDPCPNRRAPYDPALYAKKYGTA